MVKNGKIILKKDKLDCYVIILPTRLGTVFQSFEIMYLVKCICMGNTSVVILLKT